MSEQYVMYISSDKNNGYPCLPNLPEPEKFKFDEPYPKKMFRMSADINNGYPHLPFLLKQSGAFMNATKLLRAEIPRSCKKIGRFAFANTALKNVKIAEDCEYFPSSFPKDCEIEFYGIGGSFGQLYDSSGYAILDADSARIYVKE